METQTNNFLKLERDVSFGLYTACHPKLYVGACNLNVMYIVG